MLIPRQRSRFIWNTRNRLSYPSLCPVMHSYRACSRDQPQLAHSLYVSHHSLCTFRHPSRSIGRTFLSLMLDVPRSLHMTSTEGIDWIWRHVVSRASLLAEPVHCRSGVHERYKLNFRCVFYASTLLKTPQFDYRSLHWRSGHACFTHFQAAVHIRMSVWRMYLQWHLTRSHPSPHVIK